MTRVMIIGCGGAGKSTLAKQLHQITGLKLIHLDQHYWKPNWVETEKQEWQRIVEQLSEQQDWIIDGNYGGTMDLRLQKADTIIFLDRSRWLCLFRVCKRLFSNYGKTRSDMGDGCKERFNWEFMSYVFHYNLTRRPKILEKLATLKEDKDVVILNTEKDVKQFLSKIKSNT